MEKPHKKLDAWNLAMELAVAIHAITAEFPKEQRYSLTEQIRRSAISIPSNIAEGAARHSKREFMKFLYIAQGSVSELDTQLELAKRLTCMKDSAWAELDAKMNRVDKMITGLIRRQARVVHAGKA